MSIYRVQLCECIRGVYAVLLAMLHRKNWCFQRVLKVGTASIPLTVQPFVASLVVRQHIYKLLCSVCRVRRHLCFFVCVTASVTYHPCRLRLRCNLHYMLTLDVLTGADFVAALGTLVPVLFTVLEPGAYAGFLIGGGQLGVPSNVTICLIFWWLFSFFSYHGFMCITLVVTICTTKIYKVVNNH